MGALANVAGVVARMVGWAIMRDRVVAASIGEHPCERVGRAVLLTITALTESPADMALIQACLLARRSDAVWNALAQTALAQCIEVPLGESAQG